MADPVTYTPGYSFANFQANSPATPLPGVHVDVELEDVASAISGVITALKDVRRSDGALKNGVVTLDSLSAGLIVSLTNLDEEAVTAVDAAIADVQTSVDAQIAALDASKAALVHTHTADEVSVDAITGLLATDVQAAIAELRSYLPQPGDLRLSIDDTVIAGWVPVDDGSIGNAGSSATTRANDDCWPLYNVIWNKVSNTYAPVSSGRGVSAVADFAALKSIGLTKMLGRALAIAGAGSGLTSRSNGQTIGVETVVLDVTMIPAHAHPGSTVAITDPGHTHAGSFGIPSNGTFAGGGGNGAANSGDIAAAVTGITAAPTIASQGGGLGHRNDQPTAFLHAFLKL